MNRLSKFRRLPGSDRGLLIHSWVLLGVTRLGLWIVPYRWLRAGLERWGSAGVPGKNAGTSAERIAWAIGVTAPYVPRARSCLVRSLAAHALLQRRGHPAEFHLGVTRGSENRFHAHAWVTVGRQILVGRREAERFVPLRGASARDPSSGTGQSVDRR